MKSFLNLLLIILLPLTVGLSLVFYFSNNLMLQSAQSELIDEMRSKWQILSLYINPLELGSETGQRIRDISAKTKLRVTLIDNSGIVVDDSYLKPEEVKDVENHLNRPEVQDAVYSVEGHSIRYSETTGMEMLYYAKHLNDKIILRLAYPASFIDSMKQDFIQQNFYIFFSLFVLVILVAVYLARKISLPIQNLDNIAEQIESGRSKIHFPKFNDPTMVKVAGLIYRIYNAMTNKQLQLQQEQEKLDRIFSILEEGIILVDNDYNLIHFNSKAVNYLETSLKNVKNILRDINDPDVIGFFKEILAAEENQVWEAKSFKNKTFEVNVTFHQEEKLIVFFNVTEEREYARYKSELIENISHELKTPLSMILGYAETILGDADMPKETAIRFLQKIFNSSKRINGIINELLELHKLESTGRRIIPETPVLMNDFVMDIKNRYIDNDQISVHFDIQTSELFIHYEHLFSIVANLSDNAAKYSNGANIFVSIAKSNGEISIKVEDEGPIIPAEERERIFERFYTVSRSRNTLKSGSGLGLPIVKHIVQLYNGTVSVERGNHKGNCFSVKIFES